MMHLKACPRCGGDMHVNRDIYGDYKECLMCGNMIDIEKDRYSLTSLATAARKAPATRKRKKAA